MTHDEAAYQKQLATGTAWTMGGLGARSLIRLFSNIIFTRIFLPEIFGLVTIFTVFMQALLMCTNPGFTPNIIRHQKGGDEPFLHTAWTVQVLRSLLILICGLIIAYPVAWAYGEAQLAPLIMAKSVQSLVVGFYSINVVLAQRHINLARVTIIGLAWSIVSAVVTISVGYVMPNAWAFVIGSFSATLFYLIASFLFIPGPKMRFQLDREALGELYHFGKWMFLSSVLGFFVIQGDRLIMGTLISLSQLGVYYIAYQLTFTLSNIQVSLSTDILLPAYTRYQHHHHEFLRHRIHRMRRKLFVWLFPLAVLMGIFAQPIVDLFYATSYAEAGWMVRIMAIGLIARMTNGTLSPIFLAMGDSRHYMFYKGVGTVLVIGATLIGFFIGGLPGIIAGIALAQYITYPILLLLLRKHLIYNPAADLLWIGGALALMGLGIRVF